MNIQQAIAQVVDGQSLSRAAMEQVMLAVMQGEATEAQIGGLLVGLRIKGETIDEIVGAASAMRSLWEHDVITMRVPWEYERFTS